MWVTKLLISPGKKRIFCPKTTKIGIFGQFGPGHAGLFGALLGVWLGVVARGLYLARHLFTLSIIYPGDHLIISIFKIIIKIYLIIQKENQETKTIMVVGM